MLPPPPRSPLFPYTTLFRSNARSCRHRSPCRRRARRRAPAVHRRCTRRRASARAPQDSPSARLRSEEHTSELQSHSDLVCRLLLEKKKKKSNEYTLLTQLTL